MSTNESNDVKEDEETFIDEVAEAAEETAKATCCLILCCCAVASCFARFFARICVCFTKIISCISWCLCTIMCVCCCNKKDPTPVVDDETMLEEGGKGAEVGESPADLDQETENNVPIAQPIEIDAPETNDSCGGFCY